MKNSYLTKRFGLAIVAVALCIAAGVGTTLAYYTDATDASGVLPYNADKPKTEVKEEVDERGKDIRLTNTSGAPCAVRVKLYFAEMNADITLQGKDNTDWGFVGNDAGDGWIYYNKILWPGETTSVLRAEISSDAKDKALDDFAVNVVGQSVRAVWVDGEGDEPGYDAGDFDGTIININAIKGISEAIVIPGQKPSGL